jgi:hypothetical protein
MSGRSVSADRQSSSQQEVTSGVPTESRKSPHNCGFSAHCLSYAAMPSPFAVWCAFLFRGLALQIASRGTKPACGGSTTSGNCAHAPPSGSARSRPEKVQPPQGEEPQMPLSRPLPHLKPEPDSAAPDQDAHSGPPPPPELGTAVLHQGARRTSEAAIGERGVSICALDPSTGLGCSAGPARRPRFHRSEPTRRWSFTET